MAATASSHAGCSSIPSHARPVPTLQGFDRMHYHRTAPAFAVKASAPAHRSAPTLPQQHRQPPPPPPPQHRRAPTLAPAVAPFAAAPAAEPAATPAVAPAAFRGSKAFTLPPEKLDPRVTPALPASAEICDMAHRLKTLVQQQVGVVFYKFDALCYRKLIVSSAEQEPSVEQRMARAVETTASAHFARKYAGASGKTNHRAPPPPPYLNPAINTSYFDGLRSQQPRHQTTVYFVKVDAAWTPPFATGSRTPAGYGMITLRVRLVPPARRPLGCPAAIPPLSENSLVVEGILPVPRGPHTHVEVFDARMSVPFLEVADSGARVRRQQQMLRPH